MSTDLVAFKDLRDFTACNHCQYQKSKDCVKGGFCIWNDIEKDLKALVVLKGLFGFDFALRFPSNQPMLRIINKRTNEYWEIPISKEEYDLLKEVML